MNVLIGLILAYILYELLANLFKESIIINMMRYPFIGVFIGFCAAYILYKIFGISFVEHNGNLQVSSGLIMIMIIGAVSGLISSIVTRSQMIYRPH